MIEFVYNNKKNANTNHISFKVNYSYYFYISFGNKVDFHSKSYLTDKSANNFRININLLANRILHSRISKASL